LVSVAWPYANSQIHVGNITGSYLPADIFARYHRLSGNQVMMVSGSDSHGTPVTVRADAEGTTRPSRFTRSITPASWSCSRSSAYLTICLPALILRTTSRSRKTIFLALLENGYLYTERQQQWYSPVQRRFLPDRYVEGTCYVCGYTNARGDQCDNCGSLLDATQLIDPRSKIDGSTPELRETEHFYLDLGKLQPHFIDFLRSEKITGGQTFCASRSARSWRTTCTAAPSPATWIGASRCRWRAGRASACTCGLRRSSAIFRRRSSGPG
jgi:methionyl-tRNA synthetase